MFRSIERMSSLTPPNTFGIGSDTALTWAVAGLTLSAARTTTVPRSNGPATAGVTTASESGAPLYGPERYTTPFRLSGLPPVPAEGAALPIPPSEEQLAFACSALPLLAAAAASSASPQYGIPASRPTRPFGRVTLTALISCSPSLRPMWTLNGLNWAAVVDSVAAV